MKLSRLKIKYSDILIIHHICFYVELKEFLSQLFLHRLYYCISISKLVCFKFNYLNINKDSNAYILSRLRPLDTQCATQPTLNGHHGWQSPTILTNLTLFHGLITLMTLSSHRCLSCLQKITEKG